MKRVIISIIASLMLFSSLCVYADGTIASARSYWLYETGTGKVLAEYQANLVTPAASLTKLMTFLLTVESIYKGSLQWDETIIMPASYVNPGDSSMDLTPGQRVTVRQLVNGLMIVSANDAAKILAARLGGSEDDFVKHMNIRAEELGMKHTFFVNATGLPFEGGQNLTSAADIGVLSDYLLKTYPDLLLAITGQHGLYNPETDSFKPTTNTLMTLKKGVDGLKTGHTDDAGYCMAASMPFLSRKDARLIAVVMGTRSEKARDEAAKNLLDWAEKNYVFKNVIDEKMIVTAGYWRGLASKPIQ